MIRSWNPDEVSNFQPTFVFDAAFLTRRFLDPLGLDEYVRRNEELMSRVLWLCGLQSVRKVVTISSGAAHAVAGAEPTKATFDPYGSMKLEFEHKLAAKARDGAIDLVIARAFSLSGGLVRRPHEYAFSSFVAQALESNLITVDSPGLVYRRYCSAEDFLAVSAGLSTKIGVTEFDSGGELVELLDLAKMIAEAIPGRIEVRADPNRTLGGSSSYCSDDAEWRKVLGITGLNPSNISEQIASVAAVLGSRKSGTRSERRG